MTDKREDTAELTVSGVGPGLADELIDYHAQYKPVQNADIVFDVVEQSLQVV